MLVFPSPLVSPVPSCAAPSLPASMPDFAGIGCPPPLARGGHGVRTAFSTRAAASACIRLSAPGHPTLSSLCAPEHLTRASSLLHPSPGVLARPLRPPPPLLRMGWRGGRRGPARRAGPCPVSPAAGRGGGGGGGGGRAVVSGAGVAGGWPGSRAARSCVPSSRASPAGQPTPWASSGANLLTSLPLPQQAASSSRDCHAAAVNILHIILIHIIFINFI
jgi:hypothetical protein